MTRIEQNRALRLFDYIKSKKTERLEQAKKDFIISLGKALYIDRIVNFLSSKITNND